MTVRRRVLVTGRVRGGRLPRRECLQRARLRGVARVGAHDLAAGRSRPSSRASRGGRGDGGLLRRRAARGERARRAVTAEPPAGEAGFSAGRAVARAGRRRAAPSRSSSSATRCSAGSRRARHSALQLLAALPQRERLVERGAAVLELADDLLELVARLLEGRLVGHSITSSTRAPSLPAASRTRAPRRRRPPRASRTTAPRRPARSHSRARASRPGRARAAGRGRFAAAPVSRSSRSGRRSSAERAAAVEWRRGS